MNIINIIDKYKGVYIIFEDDIIIKNNREYVKVQCPYCKEFRYIRKTLLSENNKQKPNSTLCSKCHKKIEHLFFKDNESDLFSYMIVNNNRIYIDDDDIDKVKNLNIQITNNYAIIRYRNNKTEPLHRFVINADKSNIECVDHINHNTLDNRKENLRPANKSSNAKNTKIPKNNKTGFKNISICDRDKKWFCQYRDNDGIRHTKRFEKFIDAYCFMYDNYYSKDEFSYSIMNDNNKKFKYAGLIFDDVCNGLGIGAVFFTQFCPHHCKGCHNPQTWNKDGGIDFNKDVFESIVEYFNKSIFSDRLTLSGGDPLANLELTNYIASEFKRLFPEKKLWIYTGYTYEELIKDIKYIPILELADVLVDGKFEEDKRDITLSFKGSSNQRIIDLNKSTRDNIVLLSL